MFGGNYNLITAILMTMATAAWGFTLFVTLQSGEATKTNMIVCALFAALAVGYWVAYFRGKNTHKTGTE